MKCVIYDLLEKVLIRKWQEEIIAENCKVLQIEDNDMAIIEQQMGEKEKALLKSYRISLDNKLHYINCVINKKILNMGIKMGMEMQSTFFEIALI